MTIGSTASLPGHGQEAPVTAFRSVRRGDRLRVVPSVATATADQRQLPRTVLADDPPRGRILVVMDQAPLALEVQRVLRDAGYRVIGPAASAEEVERLAGRRLIDGAIVDAQLEGGNAAIIADYLAQRDVPFVWLTDALRDGIAWKHGFAPAVTKPFESEKLIESLEHALSSGPRFSADGFYPVPPPQEVWPRVFPQL